HLFDRYRQPPTKVSEARVGRRCAVRPHSFVSSYTPSVARHAHAAPRVIDTFGCITSPPALRAWCNEASSVDRPLLDCAVSCVCEGARCGALGLTVDLPDVLFDITITSVA